MDNQQTCMPAEKSDAVCSKTTDNSDNALDDILHMGLLNISKDTVRTSGERERWKGMRLV